MLYIIYIVVIGFLALVDQLTKYYIVSNFDLYESLTIIKDFFNITYIQNYGAGFSIFQNATVFLAIVAFVAIGILSYLLVSEKNSPIINKIAYLLIISGTIGNLIDRLRLTYVVDFLDFIIFGYDFPIFNVADCFITIGCFIVIFIILKEGKHANN